MKIPLTRPVLEDAEVDAVSATLRSGWIVQGPNVARFEEAVAGYVGSRHAVATSSCTSALHIALILAGIGSGDEVIVPSLTFIATANAVCHAGATPVFADVDRDTYNIDPAAIRGAITDKTRAVLAVHQIGLAADMDPINEIAREHSLRVVEDAAPSLGATYKGTRVGGLGNLTCFSFHPRKAITSAEGGMITLNDGDLASQARVLRSHGMSVSDRKRHEGRTVVTEHYAELGFNYRMSDVHAAIGVAQMQRLDWTLQRRRERAERYTEAFGPAPGLKLPMTSADTPHTFQSYMVEVTDSSNCERDALMQALLKNGISTRRGLMAVPLEPYYRRTHSAGVDLPISENATRQTVTLPLYPTMTDEEQDYVIDHVLELVGRG